MLWVSLHLLHCEYLVFAICQSVFLFLRLPMKSQNAQGSWAGAMGNTQFMPSNVAAYAIDADNNGKLDLWHSKIDLFY
jgi:membrane-bound lytic murein transglycosylase B